MVENVKKIRKICEICGKEFEVLAWEVRKGRRFCSRECYRQYCRSEEKRAMYSEMGKIVWRDDSFRERRKKLRKRVKKICLNCGKEFEVVKSRVKVGMVRFCSRKCYGEYRKKYETGKRRLRCQNCGKEFEVIRWEAEKAGRKFCSIECYWESMRQERVQVVCLNCGKEFEVKSAEASYRKFCSTKCRKEYNGKQMLVKCLNCGREFKVLPCKAKNGRGKFCSRECYYRYVKTSESWKRKVSEEVRKRWQDPDYKKRVLEKIRITVQDPVYRDKKVRRCMEALQIKPNGLEKTVCELLQSYFTNEWKYVGDGKVFIAGYVPDFIHREKKWLIEVNGDYWHRFSDAKERDRKKKRAYERCGYRVLEVWEKDVRKDPLKVVDVIVEHFYSNLEDVCVSEADVVVRLSV
jgi:very-short-patch-repair endonuclease/endogenous inhibitor of DNA gyrase (YacG/DUF329 family)